MGTWNFGSVARAHSWSPNSGWTDWGTFTSNHTEAARVNDRGLFAGVSYSDPNDIGTFRAVSWTPRSNLFQHLPTLGANLAAQAYDINEDGWVVGMAHEPDGSWRPALWHAWGGLTMLFGDNAVEPGSYTAEAYAINDHRTVVGYYCMYITCFERKGFILQANGTLGQVPGLGGNITAPTAINNNGQVAGWATGPGGAERAFTWHPNTGPVDLFDTVPVGHSRALAINDRGQIVGTYLTGPGSNGQVRGFLHDPETGLWDIGNLHPTTSTSTTALDINEDGVITGWSVNGNDDIHAYLRPTGDRYGQP